MPSWNVHFDLTFDGNHPSVRDNLATIRSVARTIREIPVPPHIQRQLHAINIVRAVHGTTGIEGSTLTEDEVARVIASPERPVLPMNRQREERETTNANDLMRFIERAVNADPVRPLSEPLIRQFHEILTIGIDYPGNLPGAYRQSNVTAGSYQAPRYNDVPRLMKQFVRWLNDGNGRSLDPIVRAIVAGFLLVSIHPFGDGNGRTSRGVESYLLYRAGINVRGFYSLANYYYQNRDRYVELLDHVRFRSDPDVTPFVSFALEGLASELEQLHSELLGHMKITSFRDFAYERMQSTGRLGTKTGDRQLMFLLRLGDQSVNLAELRSGGHPLSSLYAEVGNRTISRDIDALIELDLITLERGVITARTYALNQSSGYSAASDEDRP